MEINKAKTLKVGDKVKVVINNKSFGQCINEIGEVTYIDDVVETTFNGKEFLWVCVYLSSQCHKSLISSNHLYKI